LQIPPLYPFKQPAPAVLLNLTPIPPSLQGVAAAEVPLKVTPEIPPEITPEVPPEVTLEVPLEVTLEAPVEAPPPVLTIDWERIKMFRRKLQ
jgi:hypothetical protein